MSSYKLYLFQKDGSNPEKPCTAQNVAQTNNVLQSHAEKYSRVLFLAEGCDCSDIAIQHMLDAQRCFDRHAIVCPRLIPAQADFEEAQRQAQQLPETSIVPAPHRIALMARMKDFLSFGFLDESLTDLGVALVDFALRLNGYGFSIVVANWALVSPVMSEPDILDLARIDVMRYAFAERYPDFKDERILCDNAWIDDFFPFVLCEKSRKPRILFEMSDMMPWYCGTAEHQLAFLQYFWELYSDKYDYYIRANAESVVFHKLRERFGNVCLPDEEIPLCDIGVVVGQPLTIDQQLFLNAHCPRYIFTMLDCILLRSSYLAEGDPKRADLVRSGLRFCDGIISISDFSRDDYRYFFQSDRDLAKVPQRTIYNSSDFGASGIDPKDRERMPFDEYVLVPGNFLKHKGLAKVFEAVKGTNRNYVFMGLDPKDFQDWVNDDTSDNQNTDATNQENAPRLPVNVCCIAGGGLSDSFLACLYDSASCVVFPSQYEGFGLPVIIAWKYGKKLIAQDNDLNRELYNHFVDMQANMTFFQTFDQVPTLVEECLTGPVFQGSFTTTWKSTVIEAEAFVSEVLQQPIDWQRMDERQWHYRLLDEARKDGAHEIGFRRLINDRYLDGHALRSQLAHGAAGVARRVLRR